MQTPEKRSEVWAAVAMSLLILGPRVMLNHQSPGRHRHEEQGTEEQGEARTRPSWPLLPPRLINNFYGGCREQPWRYSHSRPFHGNGKPEGGSTSPALEKGSGAASETGSRSTVCGWALGSMMSGNQDKRVVGSILLSAQFRNQTLLSQGHWAWPLLPCGGECVAFYRERHVSTPLLPGGKAGRGRGVGELRHADHTEHTVPQAQGACWHCL